MDCKAFPKKEKKRKKKKNEVLQWACLRAAINQEGEMGKGCTEGPGLAVFYRPQGKAVSFWTPQ